MGVVGTDNSGALNLVFDGDVDDLHQRIAEFYPAILYIYQSDNHKYKFLNKKITEILGYSQEEVKSWNEDMMHLIFKDDVEVVKTGLQDFYDLNEQDTYGYQCRLTHKSGNCRYFRTQGTVIRRDEQGKILSVLFVSEDITDIWKANEESIAAKELFEETEDLLQSGTWKWDAQTNKLSWSEGLYKLMGYSPKEIEGQLSNDFYMKHVSQKDFENFQKIIASSVKDKTPFEFTYTLKNKHGNELIVSTKGKIILDDNNEVVKMVGITRDVTEQVRMYEQIAEYKSRMDEKERLLDFGSWELDLRNNKVYWSEGVYRLYGYEPRPEPMTLEESIGIVYEHMKAEDIEPTRELSQKVYDIQLESYSHQFTIVPEDGNEKRIESYGKIIRDLAGNPVRIIGISQNITRQAQLTEELLEYKNMLMESEIILKYGTWEYEMATNSISWSEGMYYLFGYDPKLDAPMKITPEIYRQHMSGEDGEKRDLFEGQGMDEKKDWIGQYRIRTTKGEVKWLETYGKVIRDENGMPRQMIGTTRDITRLKEYEGNLEKKVLELNRSNQELEEFAYVASHDLQEPLRKLTAFSGLLANRYSEILENDGQLYLNRINAASENMRILIDNLLQFSRIGRTEKHPQKIKLNRVIKGITNDLDVSINETSAIIRAGDLPEIEGYPSLIWQLFTNIITNSIKFRRPGVAPEITISSTSLSEEDVQVQKLRPEVKYFKIVITDNGIGFEPEYAEKIFQIFQRLHGKSEYPGSGIGLAICKKITEYHHGLIYALGQPGEGASFTIILPENQ